MGALSKALRSTVLASIVLSGCAVSPSTSSIGPDALASPEESLNPGDSTAQLDQANAIVSGGMEGLPVTDSSEILAVAPGKDGSAGLTVRAERGTGFSRFVVETASADPMYDVMELKDPSRVVVDLVGQSAAIDKQLRLDADPFLTGLRIGEQQGRTRFVFDLRETEGVVAADHLVDTKDGKLIISFLDSVAVSSGIESRKTESTAAADAQVEPIREEIIAQSAAAEVKAAPSTELRSLVFSKKPQSRGQVTVDMSDISAFDLRQTAATEFVLTIPGAKVADKATVPQIAPKDFPGIRSARAVQQGDNALVRMFVDPEVNLRAQSQGNSILVRAEQSLMAKEPGARAQMRPEQSAAAPLKPANQKLEIVQKGDEKPTLPPGARAQVTGTDEESARENPTGVRAADGSKIYTGRLISLDLQDTDIDNALRIIAEVSNLNIIASDDVTGKVTLRLIDVPWDQALDVILKTNGLGQVTEGNVIRIAPIQKLQQEAEALNRAKIAQRQLEDLSVEYVRISYARAEDVKQHVEGVLTERGTATADDRTNQLIVRDTKMGLEASRQLIQKLDLRTPQVLLETQIIEGARNILRDLGFQWNFSYVQSPETGNATGYNFPNTVALAGGTTDGTTPWAVNFPAVLADNGSAIAMVLDSADGSRALSARLSMLETEGKVRVVSRPQVATINNKEATIKSVETVRVRVPESGTSVGIGTGASASGGGSTAFEEIDVGIELSVTPQASPDYYVLLDVDAKSSTFGSERVDNIPSTLERQATSTILVKSGQTFALGGIYRLTDGESVEGVPWFKDLPVLGVLFRRTFLKKADDELIFFITPHIVEGSFDATLMEAAGEGEKTEKNAPAEGGLS